MDCINVKEEVVPRKGRLEDLARDFGDNVSIDRGISFAKTKKNFDIPDIELLPVTDEIIAYFNQRKISKET